MFTRSTASQSSYMAANQDICVTLSRKFIFDKVSNANQYEICVDLFNESERNYLKDKKLNYKVKKNIQDFRDLNEIIKINPKYSKLVARGLPSISEFQTTGNENAYQKYIKIVETLEQYMQIVICERRICYEDYFLNFLNVDPKVRPRLVVKRPKP